MVEGPNTLKRALTSQSESEYPSTSIPMETAGQNGSKNGSIVKTKEEFSYMDASLDLNTR